MAKEFLRLLDEPGESRQEWLKYMFAYYAKGSKQNKDYMVWQKTNHPIELSDPNVYELKYVIPTVARLCPVTFIS
jgi:hypothetical protein